MVSFSCENCGDVLTKKKLDPHRNQCRGASFTCIDCMVHFEGTEYRAHTSCISEAQKYQGQLYREKDNKKSKGDKRKSLLGQSDSNTMRPRNAYVEDADEGDDMNTIAIIDVPPRAPTPPAPEEEGLPPGINVFDFMVQEATPNGKHEQRTIAHTSNDQGDSQYSLYSNGDGVQYRHTGFSYGHSTVTPGFDRYDSYSQMDESQQSEPLMPPPPYVTPAPKEKQKRKEERRTAEKSERKRKRGTVDELDLSSAKRPVSRDGHTSDANSGSAPRTLRTGLTGDLKRLVTDRDFYDDRIDAGPTPISPIKRSKRDAEYEKALKDERRRISYMSQGSHASHDTSKTISARRVDDTRQHRNSRRRDSLSSEDEPRVSRRVYKAIEYPDRPTSVQPSATNQLATHDPRANLFMSFISKGPDSERGYSINKILKRYHRERDVRHDDKEEDDKELFKSLRLRRNSRGEIVLFA